MWKLVGCSLYRRPKLLRPAFDLLFSTVLIENKLKNFIFVNFFWLVLMWTADWLRINLGLDKSAV